MRHLEATLEAQAAAHAQQIQATAISLKHAQQSLAEVKGQEAELRVQLGSSRRRRVPCRRVRGVQEEEREGDCECERDGSCREAGAEGGG